MTHQEWQKIAISRLQTAGFQTREAQASARFLLDFHTRKKNVVWLFPNAPVENAAQLESLLQRLEKREPLPHLLQNAPFFGLQFRVCSSVLIPRPETETLVQTALEKLQGVARPRLCDLGTGSGAVAISLAKNRPDALVWATEISPEARQIAEENARANHVAVSLLEGASDWFSPLQSLAPFDALISNPPYIPASEIAFLQPEVRDYEPHLALDGGEDGLNPYRIFAREGRDFLKPGGFFALELGAGQFAPVRELFEQNGWQVEPPILDFAQIERVLMAFAH